MYELIRRFWVAQTIHFRMNVRNNPTPTPSVQDTLVIVNINTILVWRKQKLCDEKMVTHVRTTSTHSFCFVLIINESIGVLSEGYAYTYSNN